MSWTSSLKCRPSMFSGSAVLSYLRLCGSRSWSFGSPPYLMLPLMWFFVPPPLSPSTAFRHFMFLFCPLGERVKALILFRPLVLVLVLTVVPFVLLLLSLLIFFFSLRMCLLLIVLSSFVPCSAPCTGRQRGVNSSFLF